MYSNNSAMENIPEHIAIIIDGNGRWSQKYGNEHRIGAKNLHSIVELSVRLGVNNLTVYVFSKENWQRPKEEIASLMDLFVKGLDKVNLLVKNNIRFNIMGELIELPAKVQTHISQCIEETQNNAGMTLCLALNYSSRLEIVRTSKQLAEMTDNKIINSNDITELLFSKHLYANSMPDVDLLIRTGEEYRLSNFMLWQCSYAELYFCKTLWPDFKEEDYLKAIYDYQTRDRRFGTVNS
ncbi:Ditrans polycis-undecaprenyl-diphosphate synthase [termite gut metagenome]|uniref:Ditrans polycis-undecaprenyl-diphosphate synthase n=1 Tax=termite gut metagenome TaxID=433724 RepID=A0A5J4QDC6_9ZZZZ